MNRDILFEEHPYEPVQPGTPPTAGERCSVPRNQREELKEISAGGYPMDALHDFGLLTLSEVAKLLHCSKAHVCKAISGRVRGCPAIPAVSLGRRKLVRRETLLSWIENNEHAAAAPATIRISPVRGAGKRA